HHVEAQLAGSVGAASARLAVAAVAGEEEVGTEAVMQMIGEASQRVELVRWRLKLIYDATGGIGTTLDVTRTAEELAQGAVPRFTDYVTVDLAESVLSEEELGVDGTSTGIRRMQRAAVSG